jgi:sulfite reductase (NADPH) flavoprotein alpha-component
VLPGNCFAPFHWNDVFGENLAINAVTSDAVDPSSLQPEFKFCAVALQRVELIEHQFLDVASTCAAGRRTLPACTPFEELAMSCIEAFADLAGIRACPPRHSMIANALYLAGFLSGLQSPAGRQAGGVPIAAAQRAPGQRHPAMARRCAGRIVQPGRTRRSSTP